MLQGPSNGNLVEGHERLAALGDVTDDGIPEFVVCQHCRPFLRLPSPPRRSASTTTDLLLATSLGPRQVRANRRRVGTLVTQVGLVSSPSAQEIASLRFRFLAPATRRSC